MKESRVTGRMLLMVLLGGTLLASGCTVFAGGAADSGAGSAVSASPAGSTPAVESTTGAAVSAPTEAPSVVPVELPSREPVPAFSTLTFQRMAGDDRIGTAVAVSRRNYPEADTVVLARADDFADALAAAPLAGHLQAPVLLTPPDVLPNEVADELDRLEASDVVLLGGEAAITPAVAEDIEAAGYGVDRIAGVDRYATAAAIAMELPANGRVYVATGDDYPDALAAGAAAARLPAPLLLVAGGVGDAAQDLLDEQRPSEVVIVGGATVVSEAIEEELATSDRSVQRIAGGNRYATAAAVHAHIVEDFGGPAGVWLASATGFADALAAGPAAAAQGASLLLAHPHDMALAEPTVEVLGEVGGRVTIAGGPVAVTDQAPRQVRATLAGNTLPGGATVLFPRHRMVAYYGNAEVAALGVLGETTPEEAAERIKDVAREFRDGERKVMPTFELIVSVALANPGADGNYSKVGPLSNVQEYLDVAREHGIYLFLDFQPGRNRFIDQVEQFEQFLREPDVGIALDPEWRVTDTQRPGQLIGSADAAEINEVIDYLAGIVREDDLPQKLLVVHQFRTSMIRNRDDLKTPPELAVTIHVDGFGNQELKLETWNALADEDNPWFHGFKLFYDEDTNIFSPDQVIEFDDPPVDLVTYQ